MPKSIFVSFQLSRFSQCWTSHLLFLATLLLSHRDSTCRGATCPPCYHCVLLSTLHLSFSFSSRMSLSLSFQFSATKGKFYFCVWLFLCLCICLFMCLCLVMKMLVNGALCWCENCVTTLGPQNRNQMCHSLRKCIMLVSNVSYLCENSITTLGMKSIVYVSVFGCFYVCCVLTLTLRWFDKIY